MPNESKSNQQRQKKSDRRPRAARNQATVSEKKPEESTASRAPILVKPAPPVYEEPPPEFYSNLKRETDSILKITEEANKKYKKKEIQSNWAKYDIPIESYQEIEEHENRGADFMKLLESSNSIGGHFQFKHEKSWDLSMGPSLYDKYFDINMNNFMNALSCIPFYKRNCIDRSIFNETDISTMNNRSIRFKQKYYNNKAFTTPELESQDKIVNALKEGFNKNKEKENDENFNKHDNKYDDQPSASLELESHEKVGNALNEKLNETEENVNEKIVDDNTAINTENEGPIPPKKIQPAVDMVDKKIKGDAKHTNNPSVEEAVATKKVEPVPMFEDDKVEFEEDLTATKEGEPAPLSKRDKLQFKGDEIHTNKPPSKDPIAALFEGGPMLRFNNSHIKGNEKHINKPSLEEPLATQSERAPVFKINKLELKDVKHTNKPSVEKPVATKGEPDPLSKRDALQFKDEKHTNKPPVEEPVTTKEGEPDPEVKGGKLKFKVIETPAEIPLIENPEDLEKWLDKFLGD